MTGDHFAEVPLMTSAEVAILFRVGLGTVARYAREGRLGRCIKPGGRDYRFYQSHVHHAYQGGTFDQDGNPQP